MGGTDEAFQIANRMVERKRLLWIHIAGSNDMAAPNRVHKRIEIHDIGAAEQNEGGTSAHRRKFFRAEEALILGRHGRHDENEITGFQDLLEAGGLHLMVTQHGRRLPGVVNFCLCAKTCENTVQCFAQITKTNNTDISTREKSR